ncbi:MAG: hypothetical protein E7442_06300 [Ruminococcaceae bacterium]|nr:hypothetical protein [Oscillospiraceae bacterium]
MKKKILSVSLVAALIAIAAMGTLAYFTDTDDATNTFTTGNVAIDLTEVKVVADANGDLVATEERQDVGEEEEDSYDYGKLYPGQSITKDPTIKNVGSEDAYIAAKIFVKSEGNLEKIMGMEGLSGLLEIQTVISGGLVKENDTLKEYNNLVPVFGDETYSIYQPPAGTDGVYTFYLFMEKAQKKDDKVCLFKTIHIPEAWDNAEMAELQGLSIRIEAYGTQAHGFDTCFEAMTTAFPTAFDFD